MKVRGGPVADPTADAESQQNGLEPSCCREGAKFPTERGRGRALRFFPLLPRGHTLVPETRRSQEFFPGRNQDSEYVFYEAGFFKEGGWCV